MTVILAHDMSWTPFGPVVVVVAGKCWQRECRCDCGRTATVRCRKSGPPVSPNGCRSCGGKRADPAQWATTHGHARKGAHTPTYSTWTAMRARCYDPSAVNYYLYGGRGIKVCERWNSFENFLADMGERPSGMTIDRYPDKDGDYQPGNCRWATDLEQARNSRANVNIEVGGVVKCAAEWAAQAGMDHGTLRRRLRLGMSAEQAVTKPPEDNSRFITHEGVTMRVTEWSIRLGMDSWVIFNRLKKGWTVEDALTRPVRKMTRWAERRRAERLAA